MPYSRYIWAEPSNLAHLKHVMDIAIVRGRDGGRSNLHPAQGSDSLMYFVWVTGSALDILHKSCAVLVAGKQLQGCAEHPMLAV